MRKKLFIPIFVISLLIVFILLTEFSLATQDHFGCFDTPYCDGPCPPGQQCQIAPLPCRDRFRYACLSFQPGGVNVDIGRDFLVGLVPITSKPGFENISKILSSILPNIYIVAGIILLFLIIGGGFAIMTSETDPQKKAQGGKAITAAIVGFLILFASYWLVQIIEKITGVPILNTSAIIF